jgi:DNA-binding response OmpR family regulator
MTERSPQRNDADPTVARIQPMLNHPECPFPALRATWPRVGPWWVVRPLGKGGMGTVFAAIGSASTGEVALKIVDPLRCGTAKARLLAEARAAAAVIHPHLIRCHDISEACDLPYLVMELVSGGTAQDLLFERPPVAEADLLAIATQIGSALAAVHEAGVLHRDVKPANILRRRDGVWLLADFGLARFGDGLPGVTQEGSTVGTPDYMGPEQAAAGPLDGRADLYALGASLYHLATGTPPHTGKDVLELLDQVINEPFPDPLDNRPDLSPHFAAVIRKLGAKSLGERYACARHLCDDLALMRAGRSPVHANCRSSAELLGTPAPKGPSVLLIDDDPLARGMLSTVLRKRGWQVTVAEDGSSGLAAADQVDVVVVELVLPDLDGSDVVRRILIERPRQPVLVLTNSFSRVHLELARASGAREVLEKSTTTPARLHEILARLVVRKPVLNSQAQPTRSVEADADAALTRVQLMVQRLGDANSNRPLLEEVCTSARTLSLAASQSDRPAAASLATALEDLARQLLARPDRQVPTTLRTMQRAVLELRPLLLGGAAQVVANRVLVVDQDPTSRTLAGHALGKVGIAQCLVDTPHAALAMLRSERFDLMLCDLDLSGSSGFELAAEVRQLPGYERLPVIFITGRSDFPQFFTASEAAGCDLLCRPYLLVELGTKVLVMLASSRSVRLP